jgi:multisubunit Na+/H+ antiporter MnhE subunit
VPDVAHRAAGEQRQPPRHVPLARRLGVWLAWWVVMMSFWVIVDDSIEADELLVGAGAAALAALLAELAGYQASTRLRMRIEWLGPALHLPLEVARDTGTVFVALYRQVVRRQPPPSGFREIGVRYGSETLEDKTRRALLVSAKSLAPNTFALGLDPERDVMVVHQLVLSGPEEER